MKRVFSFLLPVLLFAFLSVPALAIETVEPWPPEPSEQVPTTILEPGFFSDFSSILKGSMSSIGSQGLRLLSVLFVVFLISSIFWGVLKSHGQLAKDVNNRAYRRKVKLEDMEVNRYNVLNEMVVDREYGMISDARFRAKNWDMLVTDHAHRMELQHDAKEEYRRHHFQWDVDDVKYRHRVNQEAEKQEREKSPELGSNRRYYESRKGGTQTK